MRRIALWTVCAAWLVAACAVAPAAAEPAAPARATALFARGRAHVGVRPLAAVRAVAGVSEGSRRWVTSVTSAADGRVLFEQADAYRAGVDSAGAWGWDAAASKRTPLDAVALAVLRGHELHLLAWDPGTRATVAGVPRDTLFRGTPAWLTPRRDARGATLAVFHAKRDSLPLGLCLPDPGARDGAVIEVEWLDWSTADGWRWFRRAVFHQGGRRFEYGYFDVEAVDADAGWFAPEPALAARPVLLALHERVLAAHRAGDVARILADERDDYSVSGRGELTHPTLAERRARLGPYLERTRFRGYRDLVAPEVRVSPDGRQGWVIAQVEADGVQQAESGPVDVRFVSSWIELYERHEGRWWRVGNVSNFRP